MNKFSTLKLTTIIGILLIFALLFAVGCSHKKDKSKRDLFFETWKLRAQESKGHSPPPKSKDIKLSTPKIVNKKTLKRKERPLPSQKVTLKMDNENVGVILRTLARGVAQNIIINSNVKGKINIDIKNVPWNEAFLGVLHANGLTHTWEGSILRVMTISDMERDLKAARIKEKQKSVSKDIEAVEPVLTQVIPINYANAKQLKRNLIPLLTQGKGGKKCGNVTVDTHTNSLVVQSNKADLEKIIDVLQDLDKPTPQILIEADIVEATRDVARDLGVQWGGRYDTKTNSSGTQRLYLTPGVTGFEPNTFFGVGNSGNNYGINFPANTSGGSGASMGVMFGTMGGNILEMQLTALESEGKVNIISRPSITTLDNQTAVTTTGTEIPFMTRRDNDLFVEFREAVLKLEITPHVIDNNFLKMEILVTKNEVDFSTETRVYGNPIIKKRETKTTLIVQNSETIVISGLSKSVKTNEQTGVPLLKNIPGIGWMFRNDGKANNKEEVLIFITPHILKKNIAGNVIPGADVIEERDVPFLDDATLDVPDK